MFERVNGWKDERMNGWMDGKPTEVAKDEIGANPTSM